MCGPPFAARPVRPSGEHCRSPKHSLLNCCAPARPGEGAAPNPARAALAAVRPGERWPSPSGPGLLQPRARAPGKRSSRRFHLPFPALRPPGAAPGFLPPTARLCRPSPLIGPDLHFSTTGVGYGRTNAAPGDASTGGPRGARGLGCGCHPCANFVHTALFLHDYGSRAEPGREDGPRRLAWAGFCGLSRAKAAHERHCSRIGCKKRPKGSEFDDSQR